MGKQTPEERAQERAESLAFRQRLQDRIDYHETKAREESERDERRQARLRRLSFGLLGR
jgi:hypothetical protein